jgi:hypothetical protein
MTLASLAIVLGVCILAGCTGHPGQHPPHQATGVGDAGEQADNYAAPANSVDGVYVGDAVSLVVEGGAISRFTLGSLSCRGERPDTGAPCSAQLSGTVEPPEPVGIQDNAFHYADLVSMTIDGVLQDQVISGSVAALDVESRCCAFAATFEAVREGAESDGCGMQGASLTLGRIEGDTFAVLAEGDSVYAGPGVQGALMVVLSVRAEGFDPASFSGRLRIDYPDTGASGSVDALSSPFALHAESGSWQWANAWVILRGPTGHPLEPFNAEHIALVSDRAAVVTAEVYAFCGVVARRALAVHAASAFGGGP